MMMGLDEDHPPFNDDDDSSSSSDDSEPINDAVVSPSSSSDAITAAAAAAAVTVAIPPSSISPPSVTLALPDPIPKKLDDSRRLFQRLWTDEDEIELLQGFLQYSAARGSSHHHDTAAFYDQIKSKLQLDFNKNQLVEKLRRLKKKYRNVVAKITSGKDFAFKSPHDQATFEISRKIWSNLPVNSRGSVEFDDDDQNPNPNLSASIAVTPPPPPVNSGYFVSHINLNSAVASGGCGADQKPSFGTIVSSGGSPAKLSTRKRERPRVERMDDKFVRVNLGGSGAAAAAGGGNDGVNVNSNANMNNSSPINNNINSNINSVNNNNNNNVNNSVSTGPAMQGLIEETLRSCLSPMFKELVNNAVTVAGFGGGGGGGGDGMFKGVGALALNAMPLNFPGNGGDIMDEKWRKQQILELEVYSKRLELVQDQIKLTLEELRSIGG